jgi:hypothetical protein
VAVRGILRWALRWPARAVALVALALVGEFELDVALVGEFELDVALVGEFEGDAALIGEF